MATFRRRDNNRTQARVVGPNGIQIAKTFRTKAAAKQWAAEQESSIARGAFIHPTAAAATFGTYADRWTAQRVARLAPASAARDASYLRSLILPTFQQRRVGSITTTEISAWLATLEVKESTAATALQIVRQVLELARLDRAIISNPVADVPDKPQPKRTRRRGRALNDAELDALLGAARDVSGPLSLIVKAMASLALRPGEALGLRSTDFDLRASTLTVARTRGRDGSPRPLKGRLEGDVRTIPMPTDFVDELRGFLAGSARPISGDLFVTSTLSPLLYSNWRARHWAKTVAQADIGSVVPHDLRHTAITRLFVVDRWTPSEVMKFVGHSDARVTLEVYSHVNPSTLPQPSPLRRAETE